MNSLERMNSLLSRGETDCLAVQPICMTFAARQCGVLYEQYCRDWRTLAVCQLRIAEQFDLDVLSLVSDPMREAADCGAPITWFEDQPPSHSPDNVLLKEKSDLLRVEMPDPLSGGRMYDRIAAAEYLSCEAGGDIPVLGWVEGPLAEAADLRGLNQIMIDIVDDPAWVHDLLSFCTDLAIEFAFAQAPYVDAIGIGDAACSLINPRVYEEMIVPYQRRIVHAMRAVGVPTRMHICGNTDHLFSAMAVLEPEIVDVDSVSSLQNARSALGARSVLLGNLDPVSEVLNASPKEIESSLERCLEQAGRPFIVGAGCEIPPETPAENLRAMVEFARQRL